MYLTEDKPYCFMHLFDIIGLANEISQKSIKKIPTLRNIWSSLKDKTFKQLRIQDWLRMQGDDWLGEQLHAVSSYVLLAVRSPRSFIGQITAMVIAVEGGKRTQFMKC